MPPAKKQAKDQVTILFENIIFYALVFLCILMIASFGLIAEA